MQNLLVHPWTCLLGSKLRVAIESCAHSPFLSGSRYYWQFIGPENFRSYCTVPMQCLGGKVRAKPPQNQRDELLPPITPPPMGKTTRRELSQIEKGMIIALFWFV